jgi:hypothetical protein
MSAGLFKFTFEGMLGAVAGLWEIAISAILHWVRIAMTELVCHRVVSALFSFIGLLGAFSTIGIVVQMVTDTVRHGAPFDVGK